ncbi:MAG TPA: ATP-binding cassette domain-containing protein, partial [Candidatus Salinicoccus merdavium]|nr:ATP-binding cassette domain-containing protein [Candidatus Salinicoccus merdavium]
MINMNSVTKTYQGKNGPFNAVDNVSLKVEDNEIFGLIGESGAGKSTLLRFINALESPTEGHVTVDDTDVFHLSRKQLRQHQKGIGMIFQQFNLLNNKSVRENIHLPLELHKYENPLTVEEVLAFVGLPDKADNYPSQLSGGEKQRVGIARALITRPKILLCDEPTSALDESTTEEIVDVLKRAHKAFDMTILVVTHELNVIKSMCRRCAVLEKGRLIDIIDIAPE